MEENPPDLELLWERLLSRQAELVREAFIGLSTAERQSVLAHLRRMASESGWHPEQRASALSALQVLDNMQASNE